MNRGLGFLIVGIIAILGGAAFVAMMIKNKLSKDREIDFDDFDTAVDDEEFEHFFGADDEVEDGSDVSELNALDGIEEADEADTL